MFVVTNEILVHTTSGLSFLEPNTSTSENLTISTPRFFARCLVAGLTSLNTINFFKQFGARSRSKLHFSSSSHTTIAIAAET